MVREEFLALLGVFAPWRLSLVLKKRRSNNIHPHKSSRLYVFPATAIFAS
jgi:hypothetical protein